jgi:antitoxin Phd
MDWRFPEAKKRLDELVTLALSTGPQRVVRGRDRVVIIAERDYERLKARRPSFIEYLRSGPGLDGVDLTRDQNPGRDIKL